MELSKPKGQGNGYPAFRWSKVGDTIAGEITSDPEQVTRPALDPGKPDVENIVFELRCDAPCQSTNRDGEVTEAQDWTIWIPVASQMYGALYDAVVSAGGKLTQGSRIAIKLASLKDVGKPSKQKIYEVGYRAAAPVAASDTASVDDLLGT